MKLVAVKPQDRELLWNINQKYLYEMTNCLLTVMIRMLLPCLSDISIKSEIYPIV